MENKRVDELARRRELNRVKKQSEKIQKMLEEGKERRAELEAEADRREKEAREKLQTRIKELRGEKELVEDMKIKNLKPTSKILKIGGFGLTLVGLTGIALVSRQAQIHPETITALDFATLMISGGEAALGAVLYGHDNMSTKKKRKK